MKYLNKIILFFLPILGNSVEYNSEISLSSEGPRVFESSSIKFSGTLFDYYDDFTKSWLVNPKIYYSADGQSSFSLSAGLRNDVADICIGNHVFFNICNVLGDPVYQFGKSFDVVHDKWEARVNYYFPSKLKAADLLSFYDVANQIEGEFVYKTPYCGFGGMHSYNFKTHKHSPTLKVDLPFDRFTIGSYITFKKVRPVKFGVSVSYNFFSCRDRTNKSKNAVYHHLPKFERRFFEPVEKQKPKVIEPEPVPVVVPEPVKEPEKEPESWWDWLFSSKKSELSSDCPDLSGDYYDSGNYSCSHSSPSIDVHVGGQGEPSPTYSGDSQPGAPSSPSGSDYSGWQVTDGNNSDSETDDI